MTVTLKLSADEARTLQEVAQGAGTTVEAVLHGLIAQVPPAIPTPSAPPPPAPPPPAPPPPADLEALAEQEREQEEVEANIRRWHEERRSG